MPESLDAIRARLPMPLAKAMADDTLVALAMNGEILPADHGFPARAVVSGWLGAASIKWLTRIEVSRERLYVPWNTEDYVLVSARHPSDGPARGPAITTLPISVLAELPWPARLRPEPQLIRGTRVRRGDCDCRRRVPHRRRPLAGRGTGLPRYTRRLGALAVRLDPRTRRPRPARTRHRRARQHPTGRLAVERARIPPAVGASAPRARRDRSRPPHPHIAGRHSPASYDF